MTGAEPPAWMVEAQQSYAENHPEWKGAQRASYVAPTPVSPPIEVSFDRERNNALAALCSEANELAAVGRGERNDELNRRTWKMWRKYGAFGKLRAEEIYTELMNASRINGHVGDDGPMAHNTCSGALEQAQREGGAIAPVIDWHAPTPHVAEVSSINGHTPFEPPQEAIEDDPEVIAARALAYRVEQRALEYRINEQARQLYQAQQAVEMGMIRPRPELLTDMLLRPDEDATYRIDRLLPTGGRALLAAQFKAGKTSLMSNLVRSLVDERPFLGHFEVQPVSRLVLIDTELDPRMLRRWYRDQGIVKTDAVSIVCLRGKLSTFDILNKEIRLQWANEIGPADFIILDCLRPCLDALGLDENRDAGKFLVAYDELCAEMGAHESVMVHHMGHQSENAKERARGDSRLLDWPDVNWKMVRNNEDESDDARYFSAHGRDVAIEESRLVWNSEDRSMFLHGASRSDHAAVNYCLPDIIDHLSATQNASGVGQNALERAMKPLGHGRNKVRSALRHATQTGVLVTTDGPRSSSLYLVNPSYERQAEDG